jgi:hypothetical protein
MKGNNINELDQFVPEQNDLFLVDEHFGLPRGTTYKTICLHAEPTLLNEKLAARGMQLGDWGMLPKEQRPQWKALMQELGVAQEYWKDPDLLVPEARVDPL